MDEVALIQKLLDACRAELETAAQAWRTQTVGALDAAQGTADSMQHASRLFHAQRALDKAPGLLPRRMVQLLQVSMLERLQPIGTRPARPGSGGEMGLVDDEVVNESIEISRVATRILGAAEWELHEAEQALSQVMQRSLTGRRDSPLHPEVVARTVWRLTEELSLSSEERSACLRAAPDAITRLAQSVYGTAKDWCGVSLASPGALIRTPDAQPHVVMFPVDISLAPAQAHVPAAPPRGESRNEPSQGQPLLEARDQVFGSAIADTERILRDPRLTPELRRALSAMHLVVMRFALGSPQTLYAPQHDIWSVMATLVDYALNQGVGERLVHDDFILFLDDKVQTLLQLDPTALLTLASHLEDIDTFVRTRADELHAREDSAIQQFTRLEDRRRKILDVAVNRHRERLSDAIGDAEMPMRLRQFLIVDWSEVMARTELADGPDAQLYREYWRAALMLIARLKRSDVDSTEGMAGLLQVLERGMAVIAVPSVEKHELASALLGPVARAHPEWQDSEIQDALPARTPGRGAAAPRRTFWGVRDPDAGTAPTYVTTGGLTSVVAASDAQHWINSLRVGKLVELFLQGAWFEARVASVDETRSLFTFDDEAAGRSHSLTRRALLRLVREGLATPQ